LIFLSIVFLFLSKIFKKNVAKTKEKYRIQKGEITYSDLDKPAKPFFSRKYKIAGKPDYIIKKDSHYLPVEFKSGKHTHPLNNHVLQLAAYCHLLEENYNGFVPFGVLVYNNELDFKIPFNPKIRYDLENTIEKMRFTLRTGKIELNHDDPNRCRACSMRKNCDNKII